MLKSKVSLFIFLIALFVTTPAHAENERNIFKLRKKGSVKVLFLSGSIHDSEKLDTPWVKYIHSILDHENIKTFLTEKLDQHTTARNFEDKIIMSWLNKTTPNLLEQLDKNYKDIIRSYIREVTGITSILPNPEETRRLIAKTDEVLASSEGELILLERQKEFIRKLTGITFGGVPPGACSTKQRNPLYEQDVTQAPILEIIQFAQAISSEAFVSGAEQESVFAHEVALKFFPQELKTRIHQFNFGLRNQELAETFDQYYANAPEGSNLLALVGLAHLTSSLGHSSLIDLLQNRGYEVFDTVKIPGDQNWDLLREPLTKMNRLTLQAEEILESNTGEAIHLYLYSATIGLVALELGPLSAQEAEPIRSSIFQTLLAVVDLEINKNQLKRAKNTLIGIQALEILKSDEEHKAWYNLNQLVKLRCSTEKCCAKCQKPSNSLSCCSQCKVTYYCDATCQKEDWKLHKQNCKRETIRPAVTQVTRANDQYQ